MKKFTLLMSMFAFVALTVSAQTVIFEENFDDESAFSRWTVGEDGGMNASNFAFDYVTAGIAAAPGGGAGYGVKLESNTDEATKAASQILVFPTDKVFTGAYTLSFDLWMNMDGESKGTTEFALFGVKSTDVSVPNNTGIEMAMTGENGSGSDVRLHLDGEMIAFDDDSTAYAGISQNGNIDDIVTVYQSSYDGDIPANQWLEVTVEVTADSVWFSVNGVRWAQYPSAVTSEGNISLGLADWFDSVNPTYTQFALFDNVKVTADLTGIDKNIAMSAIKLYPNPAQDILNVVVTERSNFELINAVGQTVKKQVVEGTTTIDVSDLNKGIYFVKVANQMQKVIIQ